MAEREVCDYPGCALVIKPNQELWEFQAQPVNISFAAYTQRMHLCETHIRELDKWRAIGVRTLEGTVPAQERLKYMPHRDG